MEGHNYQVEDEKAKAKLRDIGGLIAKSLEGTGLFFTLLLSDNGTADRKTGATFYISSAERVGMCKTLHEFVEKDQKEAPKHCAECGCPAVSWQRNEDGEGFKA